MYDKITLQDYAEMTPQERAEVWMLYQGRVKVELDYITQIHLERALTNVRSDRLLMVAPVVGYWVNALYVNKETGVIQYVPSTTRDCVIHNAIKNDVELRVVTQQELNEYMKEKRARRTDLVH